MLIKNCVQNEDGSIDFDFHVDKEEAGFLLTLSIQGLIQEGLISITGQQEQSVNLDDLFPDVEGSLQ